MVQEESRDKESKYFFFQGRSLSAGPFYSIIVLRTNKMNRLYLLGDSTCADKKREARPETGWGEVISEYIVPGWVVVNCALNDYSTVACLKSGTFSSVLLSLKEGDCVIIQFGHNDEKTDERGTDPWGSYIANRVFMANKIRGKKASVYCVTPVPRRIFLGGRLKDTHGDYIAAMKSASHQASVPVVDITIPLMEDILLLGDEESRKYFMNFDKGIYPNYMDGDNDNTHLRPEGAKWVASRIVSELSLLDPKPAFIE